MLEPADPRLLSVLRCETWTFGPGSGDAETIEPRTIDFFRGDGPGPLAFMPGLVPAVRRLLRDLGYEVRVEDRRRYGRRCRPDRRAIEEAGDFRVAELMRTVAQRTTGQIVTRRGRDVVARMAAVCRLFPRARILIETATKRQARKYWRGLRKAMGEPVQLAAGPWSRKNRIVVATYAHTDPGAWDVVLLPTPEELGGQRAIETISPLPRPIWTEKAEPLAKRMYAFPRSSRLSDGLAQRMTEALVGPAIYSDERLDPRVRVVWIDGPPSASPAPADGPLDWKRQRIWRNAPRNDRIAQVARALADRNESELRALFQKRVFQNGVRQPVVLLVESREHGEELLDRMPGWALRVMRGDELRELPPRSGENEPAGWIATLMAAHPHPVPARTWIWAGGGEHVPQVDEWIKDDAVLVEMMDDGETRTRRNAELRARTYRDYGWVVEPMERTRSADAANPPGERPDGERTRRAAPTNPDSPTNPKSREPREPGPAV